MIRRIELVNFMSHAHTVIEPAAGLTVLVGPNNCGKSAVVAALQILCRNDNSTYVLRHNERACSVTVETDDGHKITWGRTKTSPRYEINGVSFDRLDRSAVPDELHAALRLPMVMADNKDEFDVHFGEQKSPIFLLDQPASSAAQFFASSSDASTLLEMQRLHQQRTVEAKREHKQLDATLVQLERELSALGSVAQLESRLASIESLQNELDGSDADIARLQARIDSLQAAEKSYRINCTRARATADLYPPPEMGETHALAACIQATTHLGSQVAYAQAVGSAIGSIETPPTFQSEPELRKLIAALDRQRRQLALSEQIQHCVESIEPIGEFPDTNQLTAAIDSLDREMRMASELNLLAHELADQHRQLEGELAAVVLEQPACPTCGAVLDPSKLEAHFHRSSMEHRNG